MLPSEILLTIFKYLNLGSINNCLRVSQLFHETSMSNDLWYFLINKYRPSDLDQYYFDITYHNSINYYDMYKISIKHTIPLDRALNLNHIYKIEKLCVPSFVWSELEYVFQHLTNLIHIDISVSLLHNNIDTFCLRNMTRLKYVNISRNQLYYVPHVIFSLFSLEKLDISNNFLIDLSETFTRLRLLRKLDLCNNRLTSVPECIHKLNLIEIDLSYNNFRILPPHLKIEKVLFDLF